MGKIYDIIQILKRMEQEDLAASVILHGKKVNDEYEYNFEGECPVVAAYFCGVPSDVVVLSVKAKVNGNITVVGDDMNDRGNEQKVFVDDIFAGQIEHIVSEIK